jgi:hypothetical protein
MMRAGAITHAALFTAFWAVLFYQQMSPTQPWGDPNVNVRAMLFWLPIFIAHLIGQFWYEARIKFSALDATRERAIYREGYTDGRRDALHEPITRLSDEGELIEDYLDEGMVKNKRGKR